MAIFDSRLTNPFAARPGLLGRALASVQDWNDSRRTFNALSSLTERELSDIGLSRGDIDRVSRR